jgi:hypothetical protein
MARKSTIGSNPLDAVIPGKTSPRKTTKSAKPLDEPEAPKERITVLIAGPVINRARDACYWTPGLTMAALVEAALDVEVARLEKKRKEPFPARKGELRTGRPPSK